MIDLDHLHGELAALPAFRGLVRGALRPMASRGLSHDHVRIAEFGHIVRIPKSAHWGVAPVDSLQYQEAAFARAAASGVTPRLMAVLPPSGALPMGALVVEDIVGRPPRLPEDMPEIAKALARLHSVPVPGELERPPLAYYRDPFAGTLQRVRSQAETLDRVDISPEAREMIAEELDWVSRFAVGVEGLEAPVTTVGTDTHPGNFIMTKDRGAVFVDLEKVMYGGPAIDLAHATLEIATRWDPACAARLSLTETAQFYRTYLEVADPGLGAALRPWFTPTRRLTWLRTTTFMARLFVETGGRVDAPPQLADWIAERIADAFDPETIARARAEWLGDEPLDLVL